MIAVSPDHGLYRLAGFQHPQETVPIPPIHSEPTLTKMVDHNLSRYAQFLNN